MLILHVKVIYVANYYSTHFSYHYQIFTGAGPSGLSTLEAFASDKAIANRVEIVCFERESRLGGQWNKHGPVASNMTGELSSYSNFESFWR